MLQCIAKVDQFVAGGAGLPEGNIEGHGLLQSFLCTGGIALPIHHRAYAGKCDGNTVLVIDLTIKGERLIVSLHCSSQVSSVFGNACDVNQRHGIVSLVGDLAEDRERLFVHPPGFLRVSLLT